MISEHAIHVSCSICKEKAHTFKVPAEGISLSSLKEMHACPTCGHTGGLKVHVEAPEEHDTKLTRHGDSSILDEITSNEGKQHGTKRTDH